MRHKGSISQVNIERDKLVPVLFRKAKGMVQWPTCMTAICQLVASMPVPEFFISSDTAIVYVRRRYYNNVCQQYRNKYKQLLFDALYDRFLELMNSSRMKKKSIPGIVLTALSSPAPCCGLSPLQVYSIMLRYNKQVKSKNKKKP